MSNAEHKLHHFPTKKIAQVRERESSSQKYYNFNGKTERFMRIQIAYAIDETFLVRFYEF